MREKGREAREANLGPGEAVGGREDESCLAGGVLVGCVSRGVEGCRAVRDR